MKRARPQGLGAATKKVAVEEPSLVAEKASPKLVFELPADATAFDQVKALYETALVSLEEPEKALQLFNGVVHECLRLEAIKDSESEPADLHPEDNDLDSYLQVKKDAEKIFGSEFYFVFGDCLRNIAEISMDQVDGDAFEHVKGLLLAAKDRFENVVMVEDAFAASFEEAKVRVEVILTVLEGSVPKLTEATTECLFDSLEFLCAFAEHVFDEELEDKREEAVKVKNTLLKLLSDLAESSAFGEEEKSRIDYLSVALPYRLAIAEDETRLKTEEAENMIAKLEILKNSELAFEVLMLQGAIYETIGCQKKLKLAIPLPKLSNLKTNLNKSVKKAPLNRNK